MKFHQIKSLQARGLIEPNLARNHPMQRFTQKFKLELRPEVWELSVNSGSRSNEAFTLPEMAIPPDEEYFSILDVMFTSSPIMSSP
jgi:hypothetical protein